MSAGHGASGNSRSNAGDSAEPENPGSTAQASIPLAELLDECTRLLNDANVSFGHGSDNALDEAAHLILSALDLPLWQDPTDPAVVVSPTQQAQARKLIANRIGSGQPAPYLTGTAWLHGLAFDADARALVPRSLLVEAMIQSLPDWMQAMLDFDYPDQWPVRVLDLCCGSGSIAIHAAHEFANADITAADLSDDALELCRQNIRLHAMGNRITVLQSDLFSGLDAQSTNAADNRFDLILCNPPYVPDAAMQTLPAEFLAEPDIALRGGADGMDLIATIIEQAPRYMSDNGVLLLEIGHESDAFEDRHPALEFSYLPVAAGDQMVVALTREQMIAGT